jgi:hypothetical protein
MALEEECTMATRKTSPSLTSGSSMAEGGTSDTSEAMTAPGSEPGPDGAEIQRVERADYRRLVHGRGDGEREDRDR